MSSIRFPEDSEQQIAVPANAVTVTCTAPVNIAVIKYWGKRDEKLILPINSSLSATIDQGSMKANTLIIASKDFEQHTLSLNGKDAPINSRLRAVIQALQARAADFQSNDQTLIAANDWSQYKLKIVSVNNFPTAAGLASSAAGYACFTQCLAALYNVKEKFEGELTTIARQGSGSACRSLYGGWVRWRLGSSPTGEDSVASQVIDAAHWPEMRVLILVANATQKETSSTDGMQRSVATSPLLAHRASAVVEPRMLQMEKALNDRDFKSFAELTMMDSNQFHACCLDTYPPIFYMNETSKHVIDTITSLNAVSKDGPIAAYTFDAGPNAVVYTLEKDMHKLLAVFEKLYTNGSDSFVFDPMSLATQRGSVQVEESWSSSVKPAGANTKIHQIIVSKVGEGAQITGRSHTFGQ